MILPLTPLRFLERAQALYGEKEAIVCGEHRLTYTQFAGRCQRLAGALVTLGVQQGDRVAFLSYNCHRLLEAYYGVLQARAVLLPLNIRLAAPEIAWILNDSGARVLFLDPDFLPLVESIKDQLTGIRFVLLDEPTPGSSNAVPPWIDPKCYEEWLAGSTPLARDFIDVDDTALAELFYTSGSTGDPKGVMLSHRTVYLHAMNALALIRTTDRTMQLHTIPLFHANGWGSAHTVTAAGGTHVMLRKFDPQQICELVQAERITTFSMVPTMATALVNYADLARYDLSSVEWLMLGGAAASPDLVREVEKKLHCDCYVGYGLTETSPVLSVAFLKPSLLAAPEEEQLRYKSSSGHAIVGVELRVVDENGRDVPKDGCTMGEIVARSDCVMDGYWRRPEETRAAFRDGWLLTGDMAVWDQEGYLLIVDRKKEIIVSGGENISSIEVEKALLSHPSVYECAVIAVPDKVWGEVPKAFVVSKQNGAVTGDELTGFLKDRLAKYKIPRSFEFVTALPKGGTGKILKKVLREKYWSGQAKQIH